MGVASFARARCPIVSSNSTGRLLPQLLPCNCIQQFAIDQPTRASVQLLPWHPKFPFPAEHMPTLVASCVVFVSGFIMMVLEIIGARYLAKDFGTSFHVWVSQIGVVLIALAAGYYAGGSIAGRRQALSWLAGLLCLTGAAMASIPEWGAKLITVIVERHPRGEAVPAFWQKADPVLGSALLFLLPCAVLAMPSPCMIRLATKSLADVGRASGFVIAAGTIGSIAGVFVSGFLLIELLRMTTIFRLSGLLTALLGLACLLLQWFIRGESVPAASKSSSS